MRAPTAGTSKRGARARVTRGASANHSDVRLDRAANALGTLELGPERPIAHDRLIVATAGACDDHMLLGMRARHPDAGESVDGIAELPHHDLDIHIVLKAPHSPVKATDLYT